LHMDLTMRPRRRDTLLGEADRPRLSDGSLAHIRDLFGSPSLQRRYSSSERRWCPHRRYISLPKRRSRSRGRRRGFESLRSRERCVCDLQLRPRDEVREFSKNVVALRRRSGRQSTAVVIAVTKNFQGIEESQGCSGSAAYCIAAIRRDVDGAPVLVRPVPPPIPGFGHFWPEDALPKELQTSSSAPFAIGYEDGSLPDETPHPHRSNDVVAWALEYVGLAPDAADLHWQLEKVAFNTLSEVWPRRCWATSRSLHAGQEVASLAMFRGHVRHVVSRSWGAPTVDLEIADEQLTKIPFAAHRLHADRGLADLQRMRQCGQCLLLLGLSRTFSKRRSCTPECPILLLRVFPPWGKEPTTS